MFALEDPQIRLAVIGTLSVEAERLGPKGLNLPGLSAEKIERLGRLTASEIRVLATHRGLPIKVVVDGYQLAETLGAVARNRQLRDLETYFVQHGASCSLMHRLFSMSRKMTHRRRSELGTSIPAGRYHLPRPRTREQICIAWDKLPPEPLSKRYFRLHQLFPEFSIAALEATVNEKGIRL